MPKLNKILKLKGSNGHKKERNKPFTNKDLLIIKAQIARYLTIGLTLEEAMKLTGNTSQNLIGKLRSDPEFETFIQKCMIQNKQKYIEAIGTAAENGYWQAASWYLERKFPEEFGKKDLIKHQYEIKLTTFQNVVLRCISKVDPKARLEILRVMKDYEWSGEGVMDNGFQALPEPKEKDEIVDMNEFCIPEELEEDVIDV